MIWLNCLFLSILTAGVDSNNPPQKPPRVNSSEARKSTISTATQPDTSQEQEQTSLTSPDLQLSTQPTSLPVTTTVLDSSTQEQGADTDANVSVQQSPASGSQTPPLSGPQQSPVPPVQKTAPKEESVRPPVKTEQKSKGFFGNIVSRLTPWRRTPATTEPTVSSFTPSVPRRKLSEIPTSTGSRHFLKLDKVKCINKSKTFPPAPVFCRGVKKPIYRKNKV